MPELEVEKRAADNLAFLEDLRKADQYSTLKGTETLVPDSLDQYGFCVRAIGPDRFTIPDYQRLENPRTRFFTEITNRHGLSELPILKGEARKRVALAMAWHVEHGRDFAVLLADVDQLKKTNDIGRKVGDASIRLNAADTIRALSAQGLEENMTAFATSDSPDEVVIFVWNLDSSDLDKISQAADDRNHTDYHVENIPSKEGPASADFSGSAGFTTTKDPELAREVLEFKKICDRKRSQGLPITPAYDLFEMSVRIADEKAHEVKESTERDSFVEPESDLSTEDLISAIVDQKGGGRISRPLLAALLAQVAQLALEQARANPSQTEHIEKTLRTIVDDYLSQ